ncbi:MAG: 50S ribosomal protein L21 [Armatimonadetes bacterium]|nr:50S ribosomal protein L21 [Armatimonadota bacterium]
MYAIIKAGGKQYRVTPKDVIIVNRLADTQGDNIVINEVLLVSDDKGINIGAPYVSGASVVGKIVRHYKGKKIRGFHYKPKKDSSKTYGHRQYLTSVEISEIKIS